MSRPGRSGDEVAVGMGVVEVLFAGTNSTARQLDLGSAGRIGADATSFITTPAAVSNCAPWQMAAIGFLAAAKCWTISITRGVRRKYSGARPPGMTRASYVNSSI